MCDYGLCVDLRSNSLKRGRMELLKSIMLSLIYVPCNSLYRKLSFLGSCVISLPVTASNLGHSTFQVKVSMQMGISPSLNMS
jgi:hypothetical protein